MKSLTKHKDLFLFIIFNYLDKGISFALPLFILFFIKNLSVYNNVEYIYSIANIGVIITELGGRSYMLYAYSKEVPEKRTTFLQQIKSYFSLLILFYIALLLVSIFLVNVTTLVSVFIPFIGIRILILLFTNYYSIYYRLIDKPQYILYYSIAINLLTVFVLFLSYKFITEKTGLFIYFSIQSAFILLLAFNAVKIYRSISLKNSFSYLKKSLLFSWPIILNVLILTFINNFGKIYIFNRFSAEDMYTFSYLLRISMIVQMAHASIIAYYSKKLFLDESLKLNKKLYGFYSAFLFISTILSFLVVIVINALEVIPPIKIGFTSIILLIYVFLWCQQAFLEQYLNKINKTRWILYTSCISISFYMLMIFIPFKEITIEYIAFSMCLSAFIALSIFVVYFKRKRLI